MSRIRRTTRTTLRIATLPIRLLGRVVAVILEAVAEGASN